MAKNVPTNPDLWESILDLARGDATKPVKAKGEVVNPVNDGRGFETYPSAYANGWALAQYKRLGGKWKKEASVKGKPIFVVEDFYEVYFMDVGKDYFYHFTYKDRAESIIRDGYLRPNFYSDVPSGAGAFGISGSYGMYVPSVQISGQERKRRVGEMVALKFKTKTVPKYGHAEEVIWDKDVKITNPEIVSLSAAERDLNSNSYSEDIKVYYDIKKALKIKNNALRKKSSYKTPRKWDREHCESKSCDEMGFSEKASCRPYVDCYGGKKASNRQYMTSRLAALHLESAKRDDPKMKNTGHGGLDTWFSGHGGGKPDDRATWGDWIAVTPVKHTVGDKTYEAGDIVGPCAVSSTEEWSSITDGGKRPLKCMPRDKAHDLTKAQRATLARKKRREEAKQVGQKPVNTPTFSQEGKKMVKKKADFFRQVSAPDSLSSFETGSPTNKSPDSKGQTSSLPSGDTARNIGRPSPDSPNLKYRNLDRSESTGRTPANKEDMGYVHDSGSGSARVIPYDSGFANNSSALRVASRYLFVLSERP